MDGEDILEDFCNRIAAEIRLPEALNKKLLSKLKTITTIHGAYSFEPTNFPSTEFIIFE